MKDKLTDQHRLFYVNDKLEFAKFYDPKIIDKEIIIKNFLESKDWEFYKDVWEVRKVKNIEISPDLKEVRITT